jgi:glycosyltransferase involved in cell wall biosynthesis
MKILQLSSGQDFGGGERHVLELCHSLVGRGHEVSLLTRPNSQLAQQITPTIRIHTLPLRGAVDLYSAYQLTQILRVRQIDVLHAHYARDYPLAALAIATLPLPQRPAFFLTRHHYLPLKSNWFYRQLLSYLDGFIAVSESVATTVKQSFQPLPFPLTVIPNWLDLNEFPLSSDYDRQADKEIYAAKFGLNPEFPVLGLINQLSPLKGQDLLLKAASYLIEKIPNLQLLFAGREHHSDEHYTAHLRNLAEKWGLTDQVFFAGYVTPRHDFYRAVDIVVIPSKNEAFSLVCLEAMAWQRPVVATATGGLQELITDEETGLLFPVSQAKPLAKQLWRLLTDASLVARLTRQAQQQLTRFDREQVIDQIVALYTTALA